MTAPLGQARRIVVKVGSTLLVDHKRGDLRREWLDTLADDVAALRGGGAQVVIVSSGAIALGRRQLGLQRRAMRLEDSQAAAATGQIQLAHAYQETLARHRIPVAQILLTIDDTERRRRYLNARSTLATLLDQGAVPVVNENDTVATEEIRFGDNDRLAARVAAMIGADCLVLLSDIDGLYTADPRNDPEARFIAEVDEITPEIEAMAGASGSHDGSGGMVTKLQAARIALQAGCNMAIAQGREPHAIKAVMEGGRATWFIATATPSSARKRWIAGSLRPSGTITVDDGAVRALQSGKSLLPAGVTMVEGSFQRGDAVVVRNLAGGEVARGLIAYSAADARKIMGRHSREIADLLGYFGREEIVHRDDLVLGGSPVA